MADETDSVDIRTVIRQALLRVCVIAFALSALSFALGVVGDLSHASPPNSGAVVVLRIPPELPPGAARASLPRTSEADASNYSPTPRQAPAPRDSSAELERDTFAAR